MPPTDTNALSAKAIARLSQLRFLGTLTEADCAAKELTLVTTDHGAEHASDHIVLHLALDKAGIVRDGRFESPAKNGLKAAYDVMVEQAIGRPLADAARFTPRQADDQLRDEGGAPLLELVATNHPDADQPFYVLRKALERYAGATSTTDTIAASGGTAATMPWDEVGLFEKVRRIEAVLDMHVRPALASDGGGIDLVDLKDDTLMVQYHGACGSCSSSVGGTLNFIQDSLNNHLGTQLTVSVSGVEESIVGL